MKKPPYDIRSYSHASLIRLLAWTLMWYSGAMLMAQSNEMRDSIRINPKFMEELDRAFSFDPIEAPIKGPDVLTRDLLHEWVGLVDGTDTISSHHGSKKYDPTDPNRFDSTYFALKMYLVDFCKWQPADKTQGISIPGLGGITDGLQHYGKNVHSTQGGGAAIGFDFNEVAKYIRPSQIRQRKMRSLADKSRNKMDKLFPMEGEAFYSNVDTVAVKSK